jgi:hypothetical protein
LSESEPSEPEPSEPEPHRVPAPAPTKRCGSLRLRLRLRNTVFKYLFHQTHCPTSGQTSTGPLRYRNNATESRIFVFRYLIAMMGAGIPMSGLVFWMPMLICARQYIEQFLKMHIKTNILCTEIAFVGEQWAHIVVNFLHGDRANFIKALIERQSVNLFNAKAISIYTYELTMHC